MLEVVAEVHGQAELLALVALEVAELVAQMLMLQQLLVLLI